MLKNALILGAAGLIVALPFIFRRPPQVAEWRPGDPVVVIISPHNEAIRYEFGQAFAAWHARRYGRPAKVEWRNIGGTTEIMRYLCAEYVAAFRAWWKRQNREWPAGGGDMILDAKFKPEAPPEVVNDRNASNRWANKAELHKIFRSTDDPAAFTCKIDLFFGGGSYDHAKAFAQGLTVAPWPPGQAPPDTLATVDGRELIPPKMGGEVWRSDTFFGNALSTFGICYNPERLAELGVFPPTEWKDLADGRYFRQLGLADPTKSGSIAKAFEMIIHEQCRRAVAEAGFTPAQVERFESAIAQAGLPPGRLPEGVPEAYQAAVEDGWLRGIRLVQKLGANARYFTDSSSKVPVDVSMGDAAAGLAIDFYGRYQGEVSRGPNGEQRLVYLTPVGGSSVSADPISLLRGAEHREIAVRFIEFVLSPDGQKLWSYRVGAPGGPTRYALHRLPARRDFYPSEDPAMQAVFETHRAYTTENLGDPSVNPYALAGQFVYRPRWTGSHFGIQRDLIRAMCMDAGDELRAAWQAILAHGGPQALPEAMAVLERMPDRPEPLTWTSALEIPKRYDTLEYMREWTVCFRQNYRMARQLAEQQGPAKTGDLLRAAK